jgi:hypothetical protein
MFRWSKCAPTKATFTARLALEEEVFIEGVSSTSRTPGYYRQQAHVNVKGSGRCPLEDPPVTWKRRNSNQWKVLTSGSKASNLTNTRSIRLRFAMTKNGFERKLISCSVHRRQIRCSIHNFQDQIIRRN